MSEKQNSHSNNTGHFQDPPRIVNNADLQKPLVEWPWVHYLLILFLAMIISLSIINVFKVHMFWDYFQLVDFTMHSSIEALGAIAALLMAFMPMQILFGNAKPSYIFISLGFLQMGLWDLFHSFYEIGNGFVFTHSIAILAGGILFSLIIFPWKLKLESAKKFLSITGGITAVILGLLTSYDRTIFPEMVSDGKFTNTANIINLLAGTLFFLSAIKLISIYIREKNLGVLILVYIAVSSGIVGITFQFSEIWTEGWWLWHTIRLIAFLASLAYMLWRIQKVSSDLNLSLQNLKEQYLLITESEKKFKGLFNNDPSAIFIADPFSGLLVDVNPAAEMLMGMNRTELVGMHQSKLHPEDIMAEQVEKFNQLQNKPNIRVESQILTKQGIRKFVEIKVSMVEFQNKPYVLGIFHDISTLKEQQNQLKHSDNKNKAIINSLPGLFYQISPEGKFVQWNENFEAVSGYSKQEMSEISPLDLFEGNDKTIIFDNIQKVFSEGYASTEAKFITKTGDSIHFYFTGKLIDIDNNPMLVGMGLDFSSIKSVEEKLRESEKKYRTLIKATPLPLCLTDNSGNLTYINDRFEKVFGYSLEDIPTLDVWWIKAYPDEKYRSWVLDTWNSAVDKARIEKTDIESTEYKVTCKNGQERIIIISGITLEDGFLATFIDITDRKRIEEKLRESEEKFRHAFHKAAIGRAIAGLDGRFIQINPAMCHTLGYTETELLTKSWMDITHPDSLETSYEMTKKLIGNEIPSAHYDCMFNHKDGSIVWISLNLILTRDAYGQPLMFIGDMEDITERKNIEDRFRNAALNLSDVIYEWDLKEKIDWFGNIDLLMGYEEGEFPRTLSGWAAQLHPEDVEKVKEAIDNHLKTGTPYNIEYRVMKKDGNYLHWSARGNTVKDYHENPIKWVGSISNITNQKLAEIALLETNEKLKNFNHELEERVLERTNNLERNQKLLNETGRLAKVGGWEIDLLNNVLIWTNEVYEIHDTSPEIFQPDLETAINFYTPEAIPIISEAVGRAISDATPFDLELQIITDKKKTKWVRAVGKAIVENDKVIKVLGAFQDIDNQKLLEEELRRHRDDLEVLVNEKTKALTSAINKLEQSNQELETFNRMAVGRENRMIELKRKINKLSIELGQEAPYDLSFADPDINQAKED